MVTVPRARSIVRNGVHATVVRGPRPLTTPYLRSASTAFASLTSDTSSASMIRHTLSQLGAVRPTSILPSVPTDIPAWKANVSCVTPCPSRRRFSTAASAGSGSGARGTWETSHGAAV